jgi:hypothetical protein
MWEAAGRPRKNASSGISREKTQSTTIPAEVLRPGTQLYGDNNSVAQVAFNPAGGEQSTGGKLLENKNPRTLFAIGSALCKDIAWSQSMTSVRAVDLKFSQSESATPRDRPISQNIRTRPGRAALQRLQALPAYAPNSRV